MFREYSCALIAEKSLGNLKFNLTTLATYLMVSPATMTRYARSLEEKNWITLEKDGREVQIISTNKSIKAANAYISLVQKYFPT